MGTLTGLVRDSYQTVNKKLKKAWLSPKALLLLLFIVHMCIDDGATRSTPPNGSLTTESLTTESLTTESLTTEKPCEWAHTKRCADKTDCVWLGRYCDDNEECPDGSDEDPKFCETFKCFSKFIPYRKCPGNNKICIFQSKLCDGFKNCPDGSDEDDDFCEKYTCVNEEGTEIPKCAGTNICMREKWICMKVEWYRVTACPDRSGPTPEFCRNYPCRRHQRKCADNLQCLWDTRFCDGQGEVGHPGLGCVDGSDEDQEYCKTINCSSGWTRKCANNLQCVNVGHFCDGHKECLDGSDEDLDFCRKWECVDYMFKCRDSLTCVFKWQRCNGVKDCPDWSDEDPKKCRRPRDVGENGENLQPSALILVMVMLTCLILNA